MNVKVNYGDIYRKIYPDISLKCVIQINKYIYIYIQFLNNDKYNTDEYNR